MVVLKCNACGSSIISVGEWQPGRIAECQQCERGIGVVPGKLHKPRWWQHNETYPNALRPGSRIPILNGRGYDLAEALTEMKRRPGSIWALAGQIRSGMRQAYAYQDGQFVQVSHADMPGPVERGVADLPFGAGNEDWYELDPLRFYTRYLYWERPGAEERRVPWKTVFEDWNRRGY